METYQSVLENCFETLRDIREFLRDTILRSKLDAGGKPSTWFPPGMTRRAPKAFQIKPLHMKTLPKAEI